MASIADLLSSASDSPYSAWNTGPEAAPYVKRSKYLAEALKGMQASGEKIQSYPELGLKLLSQALLTYADKRNDAKLKDAQSADLKNESQSMIDMIGGGGAASSATGYDAPDTSITAAPKSAAIEMTNLPPARPQPASFGGGAFSGGAKDMLARLLIGEAGNQGDLGQQAVAQVVKNRADRSKMSIEDVISAPHQFTPWTDQSLRAKLLQIDPNSPEYQQAALNADAVLSGRAQLPPEIATADHFYAPAGVKATPGWDNGKGVDLGGHKFFNLGYNAPPGYQPGSGIAGALERVTAPTNRAWQPSDSEGIAGNLPQPTPQLSMPELAQPQGGAQPYQVANNGPTPPPPMQGNARGATPQEVQMIQTLMASGDPRKVQAARQLYGKIQERMVAPPKYAIREVNGVPVYYDETNPRAAPVVGQLPQGLGNRIVSGAEAGIPGAPAGSRFSVSPLNDTKPVYTPPDGFENAPGGGLQVRQGMGSRPLTDPAERARLGIQPTDRNAYVIDPKGNITRAAENPYGPEGLRAIRQDIEKAPEVLAVNVVAPVWESMKDAFGRKTRAADLNLVYGMAKIMDPGSVVREGEQVLVNNTNSLPDWLVGQINRLNGGAALQDDTRSALMNEAGSRVQQTFANAQPRLSYYRDFAQRNGFDARDVIPYIPEFKPFTPPKAPSGPAPGNQQSNPAGNSGVGGVSARPKVGGPPVQAADGNYYVADPNRPGKYLKVVP